MVEYPALTIYGIVTFLVVILVIYAAVEIARNGLKGGRK